MPTAAQKKAWTRQWTRSAADERAVAAGCYFDLAAADRVRQFAFQFCRHAEGNFGGQPFELLDWQWQNIIGPLFGWKTAAGIRRYHKASVWIAKKNGKTSLAGMLVLYMLVADGENASEVYGAARNRDQAAEVFKVASNMVYQSPELDSRQGGILRVIESTKRIVYEERASFYKVLSAEARKSGHGKNIHLGIIDEVHVCNHELYDTLRYGGASRRQPIFFEISTAGNDKQSLGYERYQYAKGIQNGTNTDDGRTLVYIAEADRNDVWEDEEQWYKANPSLGTTITLDSFRADFLEAKNGSPSDQATFRQLRLNLWQDGLDSYFDMVLWSANAVPPLGLPLLPSGARPGTGRGSAQSAGLPPALACLEPFYGRDCFAGLDIANTLDMASLGLTFPEEDDGFMLWPFFWIPEEANRARERKNKRTFYDWIAQGWIEATEGDEIDYELIYTRVLQIGEKVNIKSIGYDPWNAGQIAQQLQIAGFTMVRVPQTISSFNEPLVKMKNLLLAGKLRHGGHPVLHYMAEKTVVRSDGLGNVMPARKKASDKIDGIVAEAMAIGQALAEPPAEKDWYEPGILRN
jgi:phage terminase large subunit-like protein